MSEEKVIEVEVKQEEQDVADEIAEALGVVVDETVKLFTDQLYGGLVIINGCEDQDLRMPRSFIRGSGNGIKGGVQSFEQFVYPKAIFYRFE